MIRLLPLALFALLLGVAPACGGDDGDGVSSEPESGAPGAERGEELEEAGEGGGGGSGGSGGAEPVSLDPATFGSVSGRVLFRGEAPENETRSTASLAECHEHGGRSVQLEGYMIEDGKIANVYVYVRKGVPSGMEFESPSEAVVVDQRGCRFVPHAVAVMVNQPVTFLNSDSGLHNAKLIGRLNTTPNLGIPAGGEKTITLERGNEIIKVDCDVHPFMRLYVGVFKHPFFALTGPDGTFRIEGLPPGEYTLRAVHEKLGEQDFPFTLAANGSVTHDFEYSL